MWFSGNRWRNQDEIQEKQLFPWQGGLGGAHGFWLYRAVISRKMPLWQR
jgi:hypothetical protein